MKDKFYIPDDSNYKQHVNINEHAWEIIANDILVFNNMPERVNYNGFFNRILINCIKSSRFTLACRFEVLNGQYKELILRNMNVTDPDMAQVIERMRDIFIQKQISDLNYDLMKSKGHQFSIKLQIRAKDYLALSEDSRYFDGHLGRYLKFIFEEYAKLPNIEREQIYFLEKYEKIKEAIDDFNILKIIVKDRKDIFFPYCIRSDNDNMFNYVAGFTINENYGAKSDDKLRVTSYRLSNLNIIEKLNGQKYKITKLDKIMIETAIKKKEIRFLFGETTKIKIYMTKEGVRKYQYMIHQRPKYYSVHKKERVYEFHCTERQIINYFFKFGEDAIVLEPEGLRIRMRDLYDSASNVYSNFQD